MSNALLKFVKRSRPNPAFHCFGFGNSGGSLIWIGRQVDHEIGSLRDFTRISIQQFSTGYTSVHGERPSSEYAKKRKEALESEFGNILGAYRSKTLFAYHRFGPFLALYRAAVISFQVAKLTFWHFFVQDIQTRASKFRETLIRLGPFYIKLGQALSTRPDILPKLYCYELSKLQDQIPPFSTRAAIRSIESQLGAPISHIFSDISPKPIAAASLGQVYKAHLHTGELVAVKVQRPGMPLLLTLDALLFNMIGGQLKRFAKARKDLFVAVNEMAQIRMKPVTFCSMHEMKNMAIQSSEFVGTSSDILRHNSQVRHMFEEIDYILEAQNAERFALLYACSPSCNHDSSVSIVKVPTIYWKFTRQAVLTMEWIDGIKLTDAYRLNEASLNRKLLIDQLLEEGFFHADPHPGNLVACEDGSIAYFDFGMMGDIPRHYRVGLIQVLVHYVNRDSSGLANDFLSLGFIPDETDIQLVSDALSASFSSDSRESNDFQGIMNQLYDVMYEFNFCLPPDYALVIRALGSLEGTAKALDPDFKVVESAYPFVIGRLLADPNPDMRKILRELVIRNDGSIRWNRLERLIAAISEQSTESGSIESGIADKTGDASSAHKWKYFDSRSVVSSTEDLFHFILSEKGRRVRIFLIKDMLKASDIFLQEEALPCIFQEFNVKSNAERDATIARLSSGIRSLKLAMSLAPEVWSAMWIRMLVRPDTLQFVMEVLSSLALHSTFKLPATFWLCISRFLRWLDDHNIQK